MRRHHHRRASRSQLLNPPSKLHTLCGIETTRGLIEDQHLRIMEDRAREPDALPVALRQVSNPAVDHFVEAYSLADALHRLTRFLHALESSRIAQHLPHRHVLIERDPLGQIPQLRLGAQRRGRHGVSIDEHLTFGRRQRAAQHTHRGRFARAVDAQQTHDHPSIDGQVQTVDRHPVAIQLPQTANFNHVSPARVKALMSRPPVPTATGPRCSQSRRRRRQAPRSRLRSRAQPSSSQSGADRPSRPKR